MARLHYALPEGALEPNDMPVLNLTRMLAHQPGVRQAFVGLGQQFMGHGVLDPKLREIVILTVGRVCESPYELFQHRAIARAIGLDDARIAAAEQDRIEDFTQTEQTAIRFVEEIKRDGRVSAATFDEGKALFTPAELVELVMLTGYYIMVAGFLNSFEIDLDANTFGDLIVSASAD